MLRRIVSLGQQASESDDDAMTPPAFDAAGRSSDSKGPSGLASVFKNLAGTKLTKAPPAASASASASSLPTPSSTSSPAALAPSLAAAAISTASIASSSQPLSDATDSDSLHIRPHIGTYAACLEQLRNGSINERISAASALKFHVAESSEESTFEVWHAARDLILPGNTQAARLAGWELLAECAKHASPTNLERKEYFQMITARADPCDFHMQLAALIDLSCNGRDLAGFDYDLFPVLTEWFQTAYKASRIAAKKPSSSAQRSDSTRSEPRKSSRTKGVPTIEDRNLSQLFSYTGEVLRYSSKIASDSAVQGLLGAILDIAMNTSSEEDLFACISVIDTCVVISAMPSKSLNRCVKVLSSIYCLVPKLQKSAWKVLSNIFKSHHGLHTMRILLDTLRNYPLDGVEVKEATREVRGALSVLQKLVRKAGSAEYPVLPYALIVDGLTNVADQGPPLRVATAILQLINQLFDNGEGALSPLLQDEDWASLLAVATTCAKRSTPSQSFDGAHSRGALFSGMSVSDEASQDSLNRESAVLTVRIESLVRGLLAERPEHTQRNSCITFLADVHAILPDSGADLVIKHFNEFHCCFPSDPHWDANLRLVLDAFYANQTRSAAVRLSALQTAIDVQNVLELVDGAIDAPDAVADLARRILARIGEERDTVLLLRATSFAVSIAASVDNALFSFIIESLRLVIKNDERAQPVGLTSPSSMPASPISNTASASASTVRDLPDAVSASAFIDQSTSNIAARGYAQIFMETMNSDACKATMAFNALVGLARDKRCPVDARLSSLKLLFRLRADWANRIFLVSNTESEGLAAVLFRTEASLERKMADEVTQEILARQARNEPSVSAISAPSPPPIVTRPTRGVSFSANASQDRAGMPSRTASSARRRGSAQRYRQLWSVPDTDALPRTPMANASTVLFSHQWDASTAEADQLAKQKVAEQKRKDKAAARAAQKVSTEDTEAKPDAGESEANDGQEQAGPDGPDEPDDEEDTLLMTLDMASWMEVIFDLFTKGTSWELYSFALVHLPSQLSNHAVCRGAIPVILRIRTALCDQIRLNSSQEPPAATGLRRPDVQTCVLQTLTMILSYHEYFQRQEGDDLVRTFITGLTDKNPISCVHALSICCYELPIATSKSLVTILTKMASIITRPGVAVHILELLACLSRLPWLYSNFRDDEYRIAFGVCFRYLQAVREGRITSRANYNIAGGDQGMGTYDPNGADVSSQPPTSLQPNASDDLPQYVYALAYHVLTFWFLALRVTDRANYVNWITSRLFIDSDGRQIADEQAQITLDFMQRVAFTDADESAPVTDPDEAQGAGQNGASTSSSNDFQSMRNWVIGNSILTIQPGKAGFARITKRQPSGTSYYSIRENLQPPPSHQVRGLSDPAADGSASSHNHNQGGESVFPSHLLTQLLAPVPQPIDSPLRPILLPGDDAVERAFRAFDRNSTIDGHKVGVIYLGEGQTDETDILANISGSSDYVEFLNGLGTLVRLKGATFNTQGLDREYDTDGAYTFCWRDRVTEMVFHVTTQMPTDRERDPICINKKRHIGNDYVNIIFNDSGLPFKFDTFPSEFNYVNIVITPESRASFVARRELSLQKQREEEREALLKEQDLPLPPPQGGREKRAMPFYKVHVMVKPGFPEISPAARAKIISLKALPDFIRLLALNASVFSQVWANRQGGEHISPWRNRLRQIKRLRERYGTAVHQLPVAPSPPPASMATGAGGVGAGGSSVSTPLATVPPPLAGSSLAGGGGGTIGPGGPILGGGASGNANGSGGSTEQLSRPSVGGMRDSFNSLRRTSMATFFTVASADTISTNPRSSVYSTATAGTGTTGGASDNTDSTLVNGGSDSWLDSLDFSRWA
ncbi:gtpase activating protein [Ophiostoma piceae UAMH 11346]|uniref:Gtpase activating protein n=1 Tax=Ophiostoma piceae (strain UAMH 11346) TaxID=1262450 RepID=S3D3I9_OPHP1|nr:gtpase activating protein [Ophiostoma piceae UAMH 11346]